MSAAYGSRHQVEELRVKRDERLLEVTFSDGRSFRLPAELLRVESPSAEVQGHSPADKKVVAGKRNVAITNVEPVGHYAVRLTFDDLHDSGIYSWDLLREMGERQDELWQAYLDALEERGLSREP